MTPTASPWLHDMVRVTLVLHVAGGLVGLLAGSAALIARKGGRLHRAAGNGFFVAMLVMAVFAIFLALVIPNQFMNVIVGAFVLYLVATSWITVRRDPATIGGFEKIALIAGACLCAPFVILTFQIAAGLPPFVKSAIPFKGPIVIALYSFTAILAIATVGDAKIVLSGGIAGIPRLSRHLWRMCVALTMATGSAFTNGFARLLPGPYHVPPAFFLPQFVPLLLLAFWMIRLRVRRNVGANRLARR